ncbi:MAG: TIR domain-containing protein [Bacteroidales bacterium]|nr:TIR domain-containing protein [Bacteroidales bacterium]
MEKIKMPLATYVLYHSDYSDGEKAFDMIYQLLCRDIDRPLTDGIDIPVYLRTGKDGDNILSINYDESDKVAIIMLIDEQMFCSTKWRKYIDDIAAHTSDNVKIYGIGLYQYAFEISTKTEKIQAIKLENYCFEDNWKLIQTRLLESLYRLLTNPEQKIKLFISHAKQDCLSEAKQLCNYLNSSTKLDTFFDEYDILDGNDFAKQIEKSVASSLLVVLNSDVYTDREWCRNEVLTAKRNDIPTVIVNCVKKRVKRTFPYIGNCPMIQYSTDWSEMIIVLLKTAMNQVYQSHLLQAIKAKNNTIDSLIPHNPELFSFINLPKNEKKILYPEPPLGKEEQSVLTDFNNAISFVTPTEAMANSIENLKDKRIAFSVSESDDMQKCGCAKSMLKDVVLELSRYIVKAGGYLVYGGDLRKEGFTESFENFSYQYGEKEKTDRQEKYFTNYFAWPIHLNITKSNEAEFIHRRVEPKFVDAPDGIDASKFISPVGNENLNIWAHSLTKMRNEMEDNVDARIILGGRLTGFKGKCAGIIEEFLIASEKKHPICLIGGFGGAAKAIVDIREGNDVDLMKLAAETPSYADFVSYYNTNNSDKINYTSIKEHVKNYTFDNGLNEEDNETLFHTTNILVIVSLILKGLNNVFKS